jgi:isopenicillin-N N-acyltransferase-like protein
MQITQYPFIQVSGTPYEMGVQHGEQCEARIHRFLDMLTSGHAREEILKRTDAFAPLFEKYVPQRVEEVRGLAKGSKISFQEALLLQIRGEIGGVKSEEACTAFVIGPSLTASGEILVGQNSDMTKEMESVGIVLHATPKEGPRILMWTFGGHLGYHGMNSAGVAHFANALGGGPSWRLALPHYPVKRELLRQQTVAECLDVLERLPVCSSGNYVLTGGCGGLIDVELTPEGYATLDDAGEGFIVHTNHFLSSRFATPETHAQSLKDSFPRLRRFRQFVTEHAGQITVSLLQQFLADHDNYPTSICRHSEDGETSKTVATLIAEPKSGQFHVGYGNPCRPQFQTHQV